MHRKHYELIAHVFKSEIMRLMAKPGTVAKRAAVQLLAEDMSVALATTNPRFDRTRFLRACGLENNDANK